MPWRGTLEQFPVEALGNRRGPLQRAAAAAPVQLAVENGAEHAALHQLRAFLEVVPTALLQTDLHHALGRLTASTAFTAASILLERAASRNKCPCQPGQASTIIGACQWSGVATNRPLVHRTVANRRFALSLSS